MMLQGLFQSSTVCFRGNEVQEEEGRGSKEEREERVEEGERLILY